MALIRLARQTRNEGLENVDEFGREIRTGATIGFKFHSHSAKSVLIPRSVLHWNVLQFKFLIWGADLRPKYDELDSFIKSPIIN